MTVQEREFDLIKLKEELRGSNLYSFLKALKKFYFLLILLFIFSFIGIYLFQKNSKNVYQSELVVRSKFINASTLIDELNYIGQFKDSKLISKFSLDDSLLAELIKLKGASLSNETGLYYDEELNLYKKAEESGNNWYELQHLFTLYIQFENIEDSLVLEKSVVSFFNSIGNTFNNSFEKRERLKIKKSILEERLNLVNKREDSSITMNQCDWFEIQTDLQIKIASLKVRIKQLDSVQLISSKRAVLLEKTNTKRNLFFSTLISISLYFVIAILLSRRG